MSGHLAVKDSFFDMPQLALFYELVQTSSLGCSLYPNLTGPPHACAIAYVMVRSTLHRAWLCAGPIVGVCEVARRLKSLRLHCSR